MAANPYLLIILFNLLLYFPALKCLIIVDDIRWYRAIKEGMWKGEPWWKTIHYRLYGGGTFGIDWNSKSSLKSSSSLEIDHAFSIFLTIVISCLMYWDFHSFWAVLLFASSSMTTHIAVWLNGRRYAINIILVLLMVTCIHAGGYWLILLLPLYAATPFFHMTAFFAPVLYPPSIPLIILIFLFFQKKINEQVKKRIDSIFECDRKYWNWNKWIIIVKTYGFCFFKMIFPMMTRTCYGFLYTWGETPEGDKDAYAFNKDFYKGIIAIALSTVIGFIIPHNYLGWFIFMVLATLQWCNIINATQVVADRYVCLPNVFMSLIIASLLPWWLCACIVAANCCFVAASYRMWENVQGMFDYHFYHWPNITLVNKEYIAFCIKTGNYIKASAIISECLRYNPTDFALLHAACVCARVANDRRKARQYLEIAEKHLYFGQEEVQKEWIKNFRAHL